MAEGGKTRLDDLAASILDGTAVDWNAVESGAANDDRDVIRQLRLVSAVAAVHRGAATSSHTSARLLELPTRWGPLDVLEHVGRGSFGDVYRAWDPQLDREVALKLLPVAADDADGPSGTVEEGRLLARVRHPNVATVYGASRIDGRIGVWMEFVRGRTVEQLLAARGPFAVAEVAAIGRHLCAALAAVHDAGLLHRDVKAHNVMVEDNGRVVLMDFGTGREQAIDTAAVSDLAGTPLYLAPELLEQQAATPRSDIYSVSVLLYHLLTGTYPVNGRTVADIRQQHRARTRARLRDAAIPSQIGRVIERGLSVDPRERYATAAEMGAALATIPEPSRRVWYVAAGAALAMAVVVAAIGARSVYPRTSAPPSAPDRAAAPVAQPAPATAATPAPPPLNFHARDWVLITRFENRTGDPLLDGTVEYAIERELANSAFVNVAPAGRVEDVLRLMQRPPDTAIDVRLGREIALRDGGIRALLAGRIERIGNRYAIGIDIIDSADGAHIGGVAEEAASQGEVLHAVSRAALRLREVLGEMLSTVHGSGERLEHVTTPSLRALQLYSQAVALLGGDDGRTWKEGPAEELLRHAVDADPRFGSAHVMLAWAIAGQRRPPEDFLPAVQRATELADRAGEVERQFIIGSGHALTARTMDPGPARDDEHRAAVRAFEAVLRLKPDHQWATMYLTNEYRALNQTPQASATLAHLADLRPTNLPLRLSVAQQYFQQRDFQDAFLQVRRAQALLTPQFASDHPEYVAVMTDLQVNEAWLRRDVRRVRELADDLARRTQPLGASQVGVQAAATLAGIYDSLGRMADADRMVDRVPPSPITGGPLTLQDFHRLRILWGPARMATPDGRERLRSLIVDRLLTAPTINPSPLTVTALVDTGFNRDLHAIVDAARARGAQLGWFLTDADAQMALVDGRIEEGIALFDTVESLGAPYPSELLRGAIAIAHAWQAAGEQERARAGLERSLADVPWPAVAIAPAGAGPGVNVKFWIAARYLLGDLDRATGHIREADDIDRELAQLLAEADADHPFRVAIRARQSASQSDARSTRQSSSPSRARVPTPISPDQRGAPATSIRN